MNTFQMEQLDHLPDEQLAWFFRSKKTEMSCLEEPQILISQLRDNYLVPEDLYKVREKRNSQLYNIRPFAYSWNKETDFFFTC